MERVLEQYRPQARPYHTSPVDWNHGCTYGVAVSLEAQEVMYWMEDW